MICPRFILSSLRPRSVWGNLSEVAQWSKNKNSGVRFFVVPRASVSYLAVIAPATMNSPSPLACQPLGLQLPPYLCPCLQGVETGKPILEAAQEAPHHHFLFITLSPGSTFPLTSGPPLPFVMIAYFFNPNCREALGKPSAQ